MSLKKLGKKLKKVVKRVVKPGIAVASSLGVPGARQAQAISNAFAANRQNVSPRQVVAQGWTGPTTDLGLVSAGFRQPSPGGIAPGIQGVRNMSLAPAIFGAARAGAGMLRRLPRPGAGAVLTGAAIGASMLPRGQRINPMTGRPIRRSKGITATQLKAFVRVTGILNKYCKIAPPTAKRGAPRRGKACR